MNALQFQHWLTLTSRRPLRPLVMGILNVTPDSFSDGGRFFTAKAAAAQAQLMLTDGADLLDIGGESSRPGSQAVPADEQIRRVIPVIRTLRKISDIAISVDTTNAAVAQAALEAGATLINDISAGREDQRMLPTIAKAGVPLVLMHMQGTPATMQQNPVYQDVVAEVRQFFLERISAAQAAGIDSQQIILDPGIGFGKNLEHNLALLRQLGDFHTLGRPLLLGVSRKRFIGQLTDQQAPDQRLFGSLAAIIWCITNGAGIVRVHDVKPVVEAIRVFSAIVGTPEVTV